MISKKSPLLIILVFVLILLGFFVGGESYFTSHSLGPFGFFNLTQNISSGINLTASNLVGDFISQGFFNETISLWKTTFGTSGTSATQNITIQGRTASNYNISDTSLVGFWAFNNESSIGDSATRFVDRLSRNNLSCTICPVYNKSGFVGSSAQLDGNDEVLQIPASQSFNMTGANKITISAWIYLNETSRVSSIVSNEKFALKVGADDSYIFNLRGSQNYTNWTLVNDFPNGEWGSMARLKNTLYITNNEVTSTLQKSTNGVNWVSAGVMGTPTHTMVVYNKCLYATSRSNPSIYRSCDGSTWTKYWDSGSGDTAEAIMLYNGCLWVGWGANCNTCARVTKICGNVNTTFNLAGYRTDAMLVYNNSLYAGPQMANAAAIIYRTTDGLSLNQVGTLLAGSHSYPYGSAVFNNSIYYGDMISGAFIRSPNGTSFQSLTARSGRIASMIVYDGFLYITESAKILRSADGLNWETVFTSGDDMVNAFFPFNGHLYATTGWTQGYLYRMANSTPNIDLYSAANASLNRWVHVTATFNGSQSRIYVNGVLDTELNQSLTIGSNNLPLYIGGSYGSSETQNGGGGSGEENFRGQIDEVRIYNRSLSASEVQNLYSLGSYHIADWSAWSEENTVTSGVANLFNSLGMKKFFQFKANLRTASGSASPVLVNQTVEAVPDQPPVISIVYPLALNYSYNITSFNFTISDDVGLSACWYFNGTANISLTCGENVTGLNAWNSTYTWAVYANDSIGQNSSINVTFYVDTFAPNITLNDPVNNTINNLASQNLSANISDNLGIKNATLYVYNQTGIFNPQNVVVPANALISASKGYAVHFDGVDDIVSVSDKDALDLTGPMAMSAWFKMDNYNGPALQAGDNENYYDIIWKGNADSGTGYGMYVDSTESPLNLGCKFGDIVSADGFNDGNPDQVHVELGSWYHVVCIYNGTNTVGYINGMALTPYGVPTMAANADNIKIGGGSNGNSGIPGNNGIYNFNGSLDQILIFNRSLSAAEVLQLYNSGNGLHGDRDRAPFNSNLSVGLNFNDATGTNAYDFSPNSNNGTLTNGPTWVEGNVRLTSEAGVISQTVTVLIVFVDNVYTWFWKVFDWSGNSFVSENRTLTVDTHAPTMAGIIYSPNTTALVDPYTVITFNITLADALSGVQRAILQVYNSTTWEN